MPKAYLLRHRFALANLHAMATLLAINTFIGVDIPVNEEGSETDMCKAWEDQRKEDLAFSRSDWSLICRQKKPMMA